MGSRASVHRSTARRATAAALALVALAPAAATAAEPLRPLGSSAPLGNERLSDEATLSRWAHPYSPGAAIRREPSPTAPRVARLRAETEDGYEEVYLALRSRLDASGRPWIQVRIPMRPNGRTGWVRSTALGELRSVRTALTIDKRRFRATLRRRGQVIWSSRIGHGAPGTPTPAGRFYIRERLPGGGGIYGPWAFGTSAYSSLSDWPGGGVIGIHGTNQPWLIPGRPSHGCIRVPNPAIRRLARLMPIGTPVRIV